MSKRSQEKRRARGKEKAKQVRRMRGMSPLSRMVEGDGVVECWTHFAERDNRMADLMVFRPVRGGGWAGAFFLVDYDCLGVKDAFFKFDLAPREVVERYREMSEETETRLVKVEIGRVREMVAGAVRWSRDQGFREPAGLMKCLGIVGGTVDVANAEVREFGKEGGGLRYVGLRRDLERALVEESVEEFMEREDVECLFVVREGMEEEDFGEEEEEWEEGSEMSDEEMEELRAEVDGINEKMLQDVRAWLKGKGEEEHPELKGAAALRLMAIAKGMSEGKGEMSVDEAVEALLREMAEEGDVTGVRAAYRQISAYDEARVGESVEEGKGD